MVFENVHFDENVRTFINDNPFFVTEQKAGAAKNDQDDYVQLEGKMGRGPKGPKIMGGGYAQIRNYTGTFAVNFSM